MAIVYLDHHATTPCAPEVAAIVGRYSCRHFGNSGSTHAVGIVADDGVREARRQIAESVGADTPDDVIFTSGATESNNLAIRGRFPDDRGHMIVSSIEHMAALAPAKALGADRVTILPVDGQGRVNPDDVRRALRPTTRLVSVMAANNEVGTIQPFADIGAICRSVGVPFHVDGAQAIGWIPVDMTAAGIDLLTISGHKCYGPKGIGALIRRGDVPLTPLFLGGDQEGGLRPGTVPVALAAGLGVAVAEAATYAYSDGPDRVAALRDQFARELQPILRAHRTTRGDHVLPHNLHLLLPEGQRGADLLKRTPSVCASTGPTCRAGKSKPSHVLDAMGIPQQLHPGVLRFGLGRGTTQDDVDRAIVALTRA